MVGGRGCPSVGVLELKMHEGRGIRVSVINLFSHVNLYARTRHFNFLASINFGHFWSLVLSDFVLEDDFLCGSSLSPHCKII